MNATVKDVMTAEVVAVRRDTTFKELAAALRQHRVSAFPVVDDRDRVIGLVSKRLADLLHREVHALVVVDESFRGPERGARRGQAVSSWAMRSSYHDAID